MTAHRGLWLSDSFADRRYAVQLVRRSGRLVDAISDATWARSGVALTRAWRRWSTTSTATRHGRHGPPGHRSHTRIH